MRDSYFELGSIKHNTLGETIIENNYDYDAKKFHFDPDLKNDSHAAVIRQINDNSEVLDIGCASGIIGSILKEYKNCKVDGIEYDKKAYEIAKSKNIYDNIFNFSIIDPESKEYITFFNRDKKYDYVIFADVLEHLIDPWNAIINTSKLLKKNGSLIISIPNLSHIDIIKSLIDGDFNYSRWGILDNTHLRFFTAKSFIQFIENIEKKSNINFEIEFCERILIKPPYFVDDQDYKLFNLDGNLEDYLTLQNIFKLTPSKNKKRKLNFVDHKNSFYSMNKRFNELIIQNDEFVRKIDELNRKNIELNENINNLKKGLEELTKEHNKVCNDLLQIVNSKRWKILNKFLKFFHK